MLGIQNTLVDDFAPPNQCEQEAVHFAIGEWIDCDFTAALVDDTVNMMDKGYNSGRYHNDKENDQQNGYYFLLNDLIHNVTSPCLAKRLIHHDSLST